MINDIVTISLICVTVHALTRETGMFSVWQKICCDKEENLRTVMFEPLTECFGCMASFWTIMYLGIEERIAFFELEMFVICYAVWLAFSFIDSEIERVAKWLYLASVFVALWLCDAVLLMLCVYGLNYILCPFVCRDESI